MPRLCRSHLQQVALLWRVGAVGAELIVSVLHMLNYRSANAFNVLFSFVSKFISLRNVLKHADFLVSLWWFILVKNSLSLM